MFDTVKHLFSENLVGALATVNADGTPWVVPVHLFCDGEYVYWFSKETTQHSQNILRSPMVSVTLYPASPVGGLQGVYVNGSAEALSPEASVSSQSLVEERLGIVPESFKAFTAYRVPLGKMSEDKSSGNCWYFYS